MANIEQIKQLREATGISIGDCQKALKEAAGDFEKAKEVLKEMGKEFAETRTDREVKQGIVDAYIHMKGENKVGVLIDLRCETDFVAKSDDFKNLSHELCLQIAAMSCEKKEDLFSQPWIKDQTKTIKDLMDGYIAKLGENIILERFTRYEL
jgi:elongation factor Ts